MEPRIGSSAPRATRLLVAVASATAGLLLATSAPAAADTVQPGTYLGKGFDACTAPSSAAMQAWHDDPSSPYRAVVVYFGGNNRACAQPNLTPAWVAQQIAAGWHLIPIYLGPQASCLMPATFKPNRIDNATAAAQGRAAADDAVTQAKNLGFAPESVLIYDMENYAANDTACRNGVLAFMNAWTARLHDQSYASGYYSSLNPGVADQVANYNKTGYAHPDYLDFARYDGVVTTSNTAIPSTYWTPHRRMKQYLGGHNETYGGVTINIDNDYVDFAPLPSTKFGDFTGNGWSDVLARTTSTGNLYLYPGNGGYADESARRWLGGGWNAMSAIVRIGDLNQDGREDVLARQTSTGELWFYPGTGTGFGTRKLIGTGWNAMREITPIGDKTGDGLPDLLAIHKTTNTLYLYPGRSGTTLGARTVVGTGWGPMGELTGVGDFDRDGRVDLIARLNTTGTLYLYPGRATGFGARQSVGTGWNAMRDLLGVGDFDRDGFTDLAAIRTSDGVLFRYPGAGTGFRPRIQLATGYLGRQPLA